MNIIQIQDRLKGVTDQALVSYVENPTGDVPTYLALGELGRREEMRKKYQAQPQSTETVAEEIVSKAQGLGSIAPMGMTPQLPPQEETMSESITETGVASLPAPNVGQNYANGGIIDFSQTNIDDTIYNPNTNTMLTDDLSTNTIGIKPNLYFPFNEEVKDTYGMPEEPTIPDYQADLETRKAAFGIDNTFFDDERKALKEEREEIAKRRKGLMPDAMIRAGLNIAAGQDQNFLTNVAAGATPAFEQFVKDDDLLDKEEKLLRKENRAINKMIRAEAMGDMKGFETYNKEIRATQLKLIEMDRDYAAKMANAAATAGTTEGKAMAEAIKFSLDEMKERYPEGANLPFSSNPDGWAKERAAIQQQKYNEIITGVVSDTPVRISGYDAGPAPQGKSQEGRKVVRTVLQEGRKVRIYNDGSTEVEPL